MSRYLIEPLARRARDNLGVVAGAQGGSFSELSVDPGPLPFADRRGRRLENEFNLTPEALIGAWRSARRLVAATEPGDTILMSDRNGLGGVFALDQRSAPAATRRQLWTVAADSIYLEMRLIAGVDSGLPPELDHIIDWEIAQYRYSDRVIATSERARSELSRLGIEAELLVWPSETQSSLPTGRPRRWWVPGPVSRRNQVGAVLRAAASLPEVQITLGLQDEEDRLWAGTTWDALIHTRQILGDRLSRASTPSDTPDVVVMGDPYSAPDSHTLGLMREGVPLVVPTGGVASTWPGVLQWTNEDDLTTLLGGNLTHTSTPPPLPARPKAVQTPSKAEKISVGVPVFRDVRYLEECVASILGQSVSIHELVIVDDGSSSSDVDREIERLARLDSRVRTITQRHRGVCVARNNALESMTGDCFMFVDSDDLLEPDCVERLSEMLRGDDRLWAVAAWTRFFGTYSAIEAKPPFDRRVGRRENPIVSTAALIDMEARARGVRFEPDLAFLYCEDWHLWSQIVARGGAMGLVPEPLIRHRVHETSGGQLRTALASAVGKTRATAPLNG